MPIFELEDGQGKTWEIEGPDLESAAGALKRSLQADPLAPQDPSPYSVGGLLDNAGVNADRIIKGLYHAVQDPVGTGRALGKIGIGGIEKAEAALGGRPEGVYARENFAPFAGQLARDVGLNRQGQGYGIPGTDVSFSPEQLGTNFYERPLDVLSTISLPAGAAATLPVRGAATLGRVSRALNPAYVPAKAALTAEKAVGAAANLAKDVPGIGVVAREVTTQLNPRLAAIRDFPTTAEFATKADNIYTAAENMGVGISQSSWRNLVSGMETAMRKKGFEPSTHPEAAKELAALKAKIITPQQPGAMAGITKVVPQTKMTPVPLRAAEARRSQITQLVREAAAKKDLRESGVAEVMRSHYDDFMEGGGVKWAAPRGVNPMQAQRLFREARETYRTKVKSSVLDEIGYQAELDAGTNYTQAGVEHALRKRYRNLLRNKAQRGMWTRDELAAIRTVASRNVFRPANIARGIGKLAPVGSIMKVLTPAAGGAVGLLHGGIAGFAAGGPVGAAYGAGKGALIGSALAAGTTGAARLAATRATRSAVDRVQALVRSGKPLPPNAPPIEARIYNLLSAGITREQLMREEEQ